jgi:hypothetical protein
MDGSPPRKSANTEKEMTIPASLTQIDLETFRDVKRVKHVIFAPGSKLRNLPTGAFVRFSSLKSICIAASIEVIESYCFVEEGRGTFVAPTNSKLKQVRFEPGSKLREIKPEAFWGCCSLRTICLPRSVELITGATFSGSGLHRIEFAPQNRFFQLREGFVMDATNTKIVRYCDLKSEVTIPDDIETIGEACFSRWSSLTRITFGPKSRVSLIESSVFRACSGLKSIVIPSSLVSLGTRAFSRCQELSEISFEPDSHLVRIGSFAFFDCSLLASIAIPSSVEVLEEFCFIDCRKLNAITFTPDSKLTRIQAGAFVNCSLESFTIPSSVEFIDKCVFELCWSLSKLIFSVPCQLRELLSLPPTWLGFHDIPDSVEELALPMDRTDPFAYELSFGDESKLKQVRTDFVESFMLVGWDVPGRSLLRISPRSLKALRSNLEFESPPVGEPDAVVGMPSPKL